MFKILGLIAVLFEAYYLNVYLYLNTVRYEFKNFYILHIYLNKILNILCFSNYSSISSQHEIKIYLYVSIVETNFFKMVCMPRFPPPTLVTVLIILLSSKTPCRSDKCWFVAPSLEIASQGVCLHYFRFGFATFSQLN